MVVYEQKDGKFYARSNSGFYIHGGQPEGDYAEAWDPVERAYTETEIPVETPTQEDKAEAYDILTGGTL